MHLLDHSPLTRCFFLVLLRAQRKYAEAEPLFDRSRAMLEKVVGPEDPSVARALHRKATLFMMQVGPGGCRNCPKFVAILLETSRRDHSK